MAMEAIEMVCTCESDPHKHAHSVGGCRLHDPRLIHISVMDAEKAARIETELLPRIRACLNRWATRYAESEHAKAHVKESRLIIQEIDEIILRQ